MQDFSQFFGTNVQFQDVSRPVGTLTMLTVILIVINDVKPISR